LVIGAGLLVDEVQPRLRGDVESVGVPDCGEDALQLVAGLLEWAV
jgi:hypothetical protein